MTEFYQIDDLNEAYRYLLGLGIDYIYISNDPHPTIYNSSVADIIGEPGLTTLEYEAKGYRLFKLHSLPQDKETTAVIRSGGYSQQKWSLKSRMQTQVIENTETIHVPDLKNHVKWYVYSGLGPLYLSPGHSFSKQIQVAPNSVYKFIAEIMGKSRFDVYFAEYDKYGVLIKYSKMWTGFASDHVYRKITGVAYSSSDAEECRLVFAISNRPVSSKGQVLIKGVSLDEIGPKDLTGSLLEKKRNEKWLTLFVSDFEDGRSTDQGVAVGWDIPSAPWVPWPWRGGISKRGRVRRLVENLKKINNRDYWFTSEVFEIADKSIGRTFDIKNEEEGKYRISSIFRGKGITDIYLWWYDSIGEKSTEFLGRFFIPLENKLLENKFNLPPEAMRFRIAFLPRTIKGQRSVIFLENIKVQSQL